MNDNVTQPLDEDGSIELEYYFGYSVGPSNWPSLEAVKTWMDGAARRFDTLTIDEYDSYDAAAFDESILETVLATEGVEQAMNIAERWAVDNGYLDPQRDDPRIFFEDDAPDDPFITNRQRELAEAQHSLSRLTAHGEHRLDVRETWGENDHERRVIPQPTIHEAPPAPELAVENPYWRMETLPVNDPDGEPLGHALHMVVYPNIAHDPERVGTPAMAEDEPFRMLEMAHFANEEDAKKFEKEFRSYLIPDLIDGPELAQEVARLEGLPIEWKTLEGDDLTAYRSADLTLTRHPADWHPYNPYAERDARIEAEGLYTDPIQGSVKMDFDL
jgi:hypothetical protein